MKTKILLLVFSLALLCNSGCVSAKIGEEYADFVKKVPAATITDLSTVTQSPLWTFSASASGISTNPENGVLTITNGKAAFAIPLWGFSKTFNVSGLQLQASAEQLAQAAALKAAAEAKAKTDAPAVSNPPAK